MTGKIGKLRVLHVIGGLNTGGAERALHGILLGSSKACFENHVVSFSDNGTLEPQIRALDVPVTTLGIRPGNPSISGLIQLRTLVKDTQCDVVQGWMYHGSLAATIVVASVLKRPKLAWNIRHSLYDLSYEKPMTRQVIRADRFLSTMPNAILYNSQLSRQQHENFGYAATHGLVIPNGIDVEKFCFSFESRQRLRHILSIPATARVVGHVARLHPMKDHSVFLQAASTIALRHQDVHFLLCGRGILMKNKELSQLIPSQARHRFHLLGERDDVAQLLSAIDVFCLSSWSEAFPSVIGEAMSTGLPCVSTDVGDAATIIGDTGTIVPSRDAHKLAAGIETLIKMPLEKRRDLGKRARARIIANYDLGTIIDSYAATYKRLVK